MWKLDHKEGWALKNWFFWTVVLEEALENPLDSEDIKLINPKWNLPWIFIGRTVAEGEATVLFHLMQKVDSLEKTLMLGETEGKRRGQQGMRWLDCISDSKDLNLSKFWEIVEGQGSLVCCSPWSCEELDMTERQQTRI